MGKRGPDPKRIISEKWSANLAYSIGLLVTDGCLLPGHGIDITSKDKEQIDNFKICTGISNKIGIKHNSMGLPYFRIQFRNVFFYNFLLLVGLTPAKSKTVGSLKIPKTYFFDFLRGVFDGDGCTYSYWDKRWKSSFMYYVCFASASTAFVSWLQKQIYDSLGVKGHVTSAGRFGTCYNLKYAKSEGLKILRKMYQTTDAVFLRRKYLKIQKMLAIVDQSL